MLLIYIIIQWIHFLYTAGKKMSTVFLIFQTAKSKLPYLKYILPQIGIGRQCVLSPR